MRVKSGKIGAGSRRESEVNELYRLRRFEGGLNVVKLLQMTAKVFVILFVRTVMECKVETIASDNQMRGEIFQLTIAIRTGDVDFLSKNSKRPMNGEIMGPTPPLDFAVVFLIITFGEKGILSGACCVGKGVGTVNLAGTGLGKGTEGLSA